MADGFSFALLKTDGAARRGQVTTPHGKIQTPAFMPVGTQATVKGLYPEAVRATGAEILLGNTYHLMLRPTAERVAALGGLHKFMNWPHPILTDSGGFQVMSLATLRKMSEQGVTFKSHLDGSMHDLSPERSIEIQALLGTDITMQLDECLKLPAPREEIERAMQLSIRWGERSKRAFESRAREGYALFGIVQGGDDIPLRQQSAKLLTDIGFHGYAIGGLAVGEPQDVMLKVVEETTPHLPADHPRYLMGVGTPHDMLEAVARGARFNFVKHLGGAPDMKVFDRVIDRIKGMGWHVVLHVDAPDVVPLSEMMVKLPLPFVIDHMGRVPAEAGINQEPLRKLIELSRLENCWIKVCGAERISLPPYTAAVPIARILVEVNPSRVLWGTDFPHPNATHEADEGELVDLVPQFAIDADTQRPLLVDNPARLYGFA